MVLGPGREIEPFEARDREASGATGALSEASVSGKRRPLWVAPLRRLRHAELVLAARANPALQRELAHALVTIMVGTTRLRVVGAEALRWAMEPGRGTLFAGWHGRTALSVVFFRGRGLHALISRSRDGDLQSAIFRRFGWNVVRGSSQRSGIGAIRGAVRVLRAGGKFGITPDGPRGPAEVVQPGVAMMQRLARCPVIPVGAGYERKHCLSTWDRYQLPLPGSRAVLYFGEPLLPDQARDLDLEAVREDIGRRVKHASQRADALAASCREHIDR